MPKRKKDVIDLTESLTDLPDNLLAEILKLLPLREQARMGLVSKNLNHLSSVEFFNVIQHPAVNQLASRMKSRLRRPYLENAMFLPHLDRENSLGDVKPLCCSTNVTLKRFKVTPTIAGRMMLNSPACAIRWGDG